MSHTNLPTPTTFLSVVVGSDSGADGDFPGMGLSLVKSMICVVDGSPGATAVFFVEGIAWFAWEINGGEDETNTYVFPLYVPVVPTTTWELLTNPSCNQFAVTLAGDQLWD